MYEIALNWKLYSTLPIYNVSANKWSPPLGTTSMDHISFQKTNLNFSMKCTYSFEDNGHYDANIYLYKCSKSEPVLGFVTLGVMFLPGILLACLLAHGFSKLGNKRNMYLLIALIPIFSACFPLILFAVKVIQQQNATFLL